jgi:hypothetical protein
MPVVAAHLEGLPLFDYEELSPTTTTELIAAVEAKADKTTTSVDRLITNAMTNLIHRKFFLGSGDDSFEKYCVIYFILTAPVPSPRETGCTKTIADLLPAFDFNVNIIGCDDGFVLEIAKAKVTLH